MRSLTLAVWAGGRAGGRCCIGSVPLTVFAQTITTPCVLLMLHVDRYWFAKNTTASGNQTETPVSSTDYYQALYVGHNSGWEFSCLEISTFCFMGLALACPGRFVHAQEQLDILVPAASLWLPGSDGQRQRDMAYAGMLGALNNYIGNQVRGHSLPRFVKHVPG